MDPQRGDAAWQIALKTIRNQIIDGGFKGGEKLRETSVATTLKLSRTPVREALQALEHEGLLTREKSGFRVRSFSLNEVFDAIEIRGVLEATAARLATERGPNRQGLSEMQDTLNLIDLAINANQPDLYEQLNTQFHYQLAALSGSRLIEEEVLRSYRFPFAAPSGFPSNAAGLHKFRTSLDIGQNQHWAMFAALEQGDAALAYSLTIEHARLGAENVRAAYQDINTKAPDLPQLALVRS